jgi:hypothetical protein
MNARPSNLRAAPAELTPERVERLLMLFADGRRPARARDGTYPFLGHRTVAEIDAATAPDSERNPA